MGSWFWKTAGVAAKTGQCREEPAAVQNGETVAKRMLDPQVDLVPPRLGEEPAGVHASEVETKPTPGTQADLASSVSEEEAIGAQTSEHETDPPSNPQIDLTSKVEGINGIHSSEVETNPPLHPQVDVVPPIPGQVQGSGLIPFTGPIQTDVASDAGALFQKHRCPTPDHLPRQHTADSGCDVTHTNDHDIEKDQVPLSMQAPGAPNGKIDKAVSAKSESADSRARKRARERFIQELHNLSEKRSSVLALRFKIQAARASLKREREALGVLDAELLQKARVAVANNDFTELGSLLNLFEGLQRSRDILKPKEDEYEVLEGTLNHQEWELKEMEQRLFPEGNSVQMSLFGDEDIGRFERELEETKSSLGSSAAHADDSPLMKRYLSRKGDADVLREQLFETWEERALLLERKETRARIGLELDKESQAILEDFVVRYDALQRELENVEEDISDLREALTNKDDVFFSINLFDPNGREANSADAVASYLPDLSYQGEDEAIPTDPEPVPNDPILVSDDDDPHDMLSSSDIGTRAGISTTRYINRWMLHKLRRSRSELRLFRSTDKYQELQTELSQEEIRDLLLEWWFKDQSVEDYEESRAVANTVLDLSDATDGERFLGLSEASESDIPTLLKPILQSRENELLDAYSSTYDPPIQAVRSLSPGD